MSKRPFPEARQWAQAKGAKDRLGAAGWHECRSVHAHARRSLPINGGVSRACRPDGLTGMGAMGRRPALIGRLPSSGRVGLTPRPGVRLALPSCPNSCLATRLGETPVSRPVPRRDAKQEFRGSRSQTGVWERGKEGNGPKGLHCSNDSKAYAFHTVGANVVFADGSLHLLSSGINQCVLAGLVTRAGGEVIDASPY
jgi:prepilin-type processing-associated H-X9-DG protein